MQTIKAMRLILTGYVLLSLGTLGIGVYGVLQTENLIKITSDLYAHPFAVSNAAVDLEGTIYKIRYRMLEMGLQEQPRDRIAMYRREINDLDTRASRDLEIVRKNFLGDLGLVQSIDSNLAQWRDLRAMIFSAAENNDRAAVTTLLETAGTDEFNKLIGLIDGVHDFAVNRGRQFVEQSLDVFHKLKIITYSLVIAVIVISSFSAGVVWQLFDQLKQQASQDHLTRIPNRRHILELLDNELLRCQRYGSNLAVVMADLDNFKKINDTYGHQIGDFVLVELVKICTSSLRTVDIIGRVGGEEFAILLPNTSIHEAEKAIENLRTRIAGSPIDVGGDAPLRVTASFGLTAYRSGDQKTETLLERADSALYEAKRNGRDKVCIK